MSQRAVERLLGRLITDAEFRRCFYEDAAAACAAAGHALTPRELEALQATDETAVRGFAAQLDPRIVRAALSRATSAPASGRVRPASTPTGKRA